MMVNVFRLSPGSARLYIGIPTTWSRCDEGGFVGNFSNFEFPGPVKFKIRNLTFFFWSTTPLVHSNRFQIQGVLPRGFFCCCVKCVLCYIEEI